MGVHSELFEIDARVGQMRQLTDGSHFVVPGGRFCRRRTDSVQLDEPTRFGDVDARAGGGRR